MTDTEGSVSAVLGNDHRRLDGILADVKRLVASGDPGTARSRFQAFRDGLERHIEAEEEALFPVFEELSGTRGAGPTAVMRMEHDELRKRMADLEGRLEAGAGADLTAHLAALTALIQAHNGKEERILYPASDQLAGEAGRLGKLIGSLRGYV